MSRIDCRFNLHERNKRAPAGLVLAFVGIGMLIYFIVKDTNVR